MVQNSSFTAGATLYGGKQADTLTAYGNQSTVSGGLGADNIVLGGQKQTLEYTRGDGVDNLSGSGKDAVIALNGGIDLDGLGLEVNAIQQLSVRLGAGAGDRMNLDMYLNALGANRLIDRFTLTGSSQTLSFKELLARGVKVTGTDENAINSVAACARQQRVTRRFVCETRYKNTTSQPSMRHSSRSDTQNAHARSARLAGHKWLGRRMDVARRIHDARASAFTTNRQRNISTTSMLHLNLAVTSSRNEEIQ